MNKVIGLIIILFLTPGIYSREITFLPAYVSGEEPESLKRKEDRLGEGIAELGAFYLEDNFNAEITDFHKLLNYIESLDEPMDRKPTRRLINSICSEFDSDYVARTEIDFGKTIAVLTEVYNCKGRIIASHETSIQAGFYTSFEKHIKKTLNFLPEKEKTDYSKFFNSSQEIVYLVDFSGSFSNEVKSFKTYLESIYSTNNLSLGIVGVNNQKIHIVPPTVDHSKIREELAREKFSGEVGMDSLVLGILKARTILGKSNATRKKFVILTDSKEKSGSEYSYFSAVQGISALSYKVYIVTGSYFDHKTLNIHKKAARNAGSELFQLTHYQKVGTTNGFKTIYLNDRNIYFDSSARMNPKDLDFKELNKIDDDQIYSRVDFPHPDNMASLYSEIYNQKIIEKSEIKSNINEILDSIYNIGSINYHQDSRKALIKVQKSSIWLNVKEANDNLLDKFVSYRATFILDPMNTSGFSNIPDETTLYEENVPGLLVMNPSEIRTYMTANRLKSFSCFIRGKVVEVK